MGDLFFNKLAGAIIMTALIIMGLAELSRRLVHAATPGTLAYAVDLSATVASSSAEEEDVGPVDFGLLLANADLSSGERVSRRCTSCHSFEEGGPDMIGPHMWDVMGRKVASVDGYAYSGAMKVYGEGGALWGYENMYAYLERPSAYVEGTAMSFAGLRDRDDRIDIIAYMRTLSADPLPLPEPTAGADASEAAGTGVRGEVVEG